MTRELAQDVDIELWVFNTALAIRYRLIVESYISGKTLCHYVYDALELPNDVLAIGGQTGLQFTYQLVMNSQSTDDNDRRAQIIDGQECSIAELGIYDGTQLELQISIAQIGSNRVSVPAVYRGDEDEVKEQDENFIPRALKRRLLKKAFGHLSDRF